MIGVGVKVGVDVGAGVYGAGVAVGRKLTTAIGRVVAVAVNVGVALVMIWPQPDRAEIIARKSAESRYLCLTK